MSEIMKLNTDKARSDPEAVFKSPAELVAEVGLTSGQKRAALERWARLVQQRLDAASEGMTAEAGKSSDDAEQLRQIGIARSQLLDNKRN